VKSVALAGIREFVINEVPPPEIAHDSGVLVRIKMVGVCGSDIHYYTSGRISTQQVQFPFIIGHEAAGIVEAVGKGITRVKPGQKIAIDPALSCGRCDQCMAGRENTCRKLLFLGAPGQLPGCLSELVVLDEHSCYPVPDYMTFEQATLSEPLAVGVYAVERSGLTDKANVAILGAGPIGLSVLHVLRTRETGNIYVTEKIEARLAHAGELKPKWSGNPDRVDVVAEIARIEPLMLDAVFECSGKADAIAQGIQLLKPGGTLIIVGIPEEEEISFPIHELRRKEITILSIRRQACCTQKAIDLLAQGKVKMDEMATHNFPLEETGRAFELVASRRDGVIKAMITL
jgi:L-iditol 2-dehydrogenase